jgi:hypothetical protein
MPSSTAYRFNGEGLMKTTLFASLLLASTVLAVGAAAAQPFPFNEARKPRRHGRQQRRWRTPAARHRSPRRDRRLGRPGHRPARACPGRPGSEAALRRHRFAADVPLSGVAALQGRGFAEGGGELCMRDGSVGWASRLHGDPCCMYLRGRDAHAVPPSP